MAKNFLTVYDYNNSNTIVPLKNGHTTKDIKSIYVTILTGDEVGTIYYNDGDSQQFDAFTDPRGRYNDFNDGSYTVKDVQRWIDFKPDEEDRWCTYAYQRDRYYNNY